MKPLKDSYPVLEQTLCHVLITNQNIFTGRFFSQDVEVCWDDELAANTTLELKNAAHTFVSLLFFFFAPVESRSV